MEKEVNILKKILSLLLVLCMASVVFVGCKKDGLTKIRLNEVTHSVFYAPLYIAINNGYMEEEGLKIELTNGGGSDISMAALLSNSADIALLGPETLVYVINEGSTNHPKIFGQLTKRDGSFLLGRNAEPDFNWLNLAGKEVIGGRKGGLPAMTLQYVLNSKGLTNDNMTLNLDVAFDAIGPTFIGGQGDYCTMFEPAANQLIEEGVAHIVASVGAESGEVPFTCFMATSSFLSKNPDKVQAFLRAINKAYNFMMTNTAEDVAKSLAPSFDGTSVEVLTKVVNRYRDIDAWASSSAMTSAAFGKLIDIMVNAGMDVSDVKFSDAVDNSFAYAL